MNKNTQISTTVLKGIQTNVEAGAQDGTCQHIVNLRNKHGEWRSVGVKSELNAVPLETSIVEADGDYIIKILIHPALGEMYRLVAMRFEADANDTISLYRLTDERSAWEKTQDIYDVDSASVRVEDMQVFGRWLIVNVNTAAGVIYYVLNDTLKKFIKVDNPALGYSYLSPTDYSDLKTGVEAPNPNTAGREAHMGPYYEDLYDELKNHNRGRGGIFGRLAFRSADKDVWVGPVMYTHLGMCLMEDDGFKPNGAYDRIYLNDSIYPSVYTDPDPDKFYINRYRFSGVQLCYKFDDIASLQTLKDNNLAVRLVLYVSRLFDLKDYIVQSFTLRQAGKPNIYDYALSNDQNQPSDTIDTYTANMYELWSVDLDTLISQGPTDMVVNLELKNIQTISTDRQLVVEEHTWDRFKGEHILDYNARLHLSNVSRFRDIQHIHPLCRPGDAHLIKRFWATPGEYGTGNWLYRPLSPNALTNIIPLNNYSIQFHAVSISDGRKNRVQKNITANATIWSEQYGTDAETKWYIFISPVVFLPYVNYTEFFLTIKRNSDGEERFLYSSNKSLLNENKAISTPDRYFYKDFKYLLSSQNALAPIRVPIPATGFALTPPLYTTITVTFNFESMPLFASYISNIPEGAIINTNRLQVSSQENPLLLPARHSYRFGTVANNLIAAMPAAQTMSEGQFGQFPLYIFTSMGIYALEQGDSNTLYSNIRPLNQEIAINKNLIIAVQGAVFFVTRQGMKAMVGGEVKWVGEALDGPFASLLDSSKYFTQIITDNWLSNIEPVVISNIPFADQLEASQIAYDHQEEEIIIQTPAKQFVYCLKSGVWVERSDNYDFLYPAWPGYEFARVVDYHVPGLCLTFYDPHREETNQATPIYVESNRIVTDYKAIKAFSNILLNCNLHILDNKRVGLYVFGSEDDDVYKLLAGREEQGHKRRMKIGHIPAGLRSIIAIISGTVDELSTLNEIVTEYVPRYQGKIR